MSVELYFTGRHDHHLHHDEGHQPAAQHVHGGCLSLLRHVDVSPPCDEVDQARCSKTVQGRTFVEYLPLMLPAGVDSAARVHLVVLLVLHGGPPHRDPPHHGQYRHGQNKNYILISSSSLFSVQMECHLLSTWGRLLFS